jgi:hypothetical protein
MRRRVQQILFDCSITLLVLFSILWIWSSFGGLAVTHDEWTDAHYVSPKSGRPVEHVNSWRFVFSDGRIGLSRLAAYEYRPPSVASDNSRWHWTRVGDSEWDGAWQPIGFAFNSETHAAPPNVAPGKSFLIGVPFWFLMLLAALLAIPRLTRRVQRDKRFAAGCCTRCGYDLRATPDKCPECGAIPSRAP